jgi:hypothetical protein
MQEINLCKHTTHTVEQPQEIIMEIKHNRPRQDIAV